MAVADYDEREMFSALFPLVAAWPTPETIAAVMPRWHKLADPDAVRRELVVPDYPHAIRRHNTAAWSRENVAVVRIPHELLACHAAEVADVVASPERARAVAPATRCVPNDEHLVAQLALLRRRPLEVAPLVWAHRVAHTDERGLILLAEDTRDWAPWVPMLRVAKSLRELDESNVVLRAAEHRLRLIARRMLDAMTLTDVLVDDTLNLPPVMQRAVTELLGRETPLT